MAENKKSSALQNSIKDQDLFGHVININFDKQGNTYNTVVGGWVSLVVKSILLVYISL